MALVHEFEKSGNWLFRRRSWLPVILVVLGIVMMYLGNRQAIIFDLRDELIFLSVTLLGQLIRVLAAGFASKNTSGRNTAHGQIADDLNTTGLYSLIRHPLYLGNFFMWLGPVLFLRSAAVTIVFGLVYWLYYERIMFAEEQFLRRKFGEEYDRWSERVASFLPLSFSWVPPRHRFSVKKVLRNEYNSFVNIFVMFTLLDLFRNYFLSEKIYLTGLWLWLFATSLIIWLIIRSIHKYTSWFNLK
jgi:protein-S-isoprenylcysteine O-methyltransferase Ste14